MIISGSPEVMATAVPYCRIRGFSLIATLCDLAYTWGVMGHHRFVLERPMGPLVNPANCLAFLQDPTTRTYENQEPPPPCEKEIISASCSLRLLTNSLTKTLTKQHLLI